MKTILTLALLLLVVTIVYIANPFALNIATTKVNIFNNDNVQNKLDKLIEQNITRVVNNNNIINFLTKEREQTTINKLWVDKTEVLQGDLYKFNNWLQENTAKQNVVSISADDKLFGRKTVAANGVNFFDAQKYCKATKGRLLTTSEFYTIANSTNTIYSWGDEFNAKIYPYYDVVLNTTINPKNTNFDVTADGVKNLSSIVSEWTTKANNSVSQISGANGYLRPYNIYAINGFSVDFNPNHRSKFVGFRCAYDIKPDNLTPWQTTIEAVLITNKTTNNDLVNNSKILPLLRYIKNIGAANIDKIIKHKDKIDNVAIANRRITVRDYNSFLQDIFVNFNIYKHKAEPKKHSRTPLYWQQQQQNLDNEVVGISYWNAYEFANWLGARLPNYNELVQINIDQEQHDEYSQINFDNKASEWTKTIDSSEANLMMIVYGSNTTLSNNKNVEKGFRRSIEPNNKLNDIGFRVVFNN